MKCNHCKKEKEPFELYRYKSRTYVTVNGETRDYWTHKCRDCSYEMHVEQMKKQHGKETAKRAVKKYLKVNTKKQRAWSLARKINKHKEPCEVCGEKNVHKHHEDYSKPLEVRWLCPLHHKQIHKI